MAVGLTRVVCTCWKIIEKNDVRRHISQIKFMKTFVIKGRGGDMLCRVGLFVCVPATAGA